MIDIDRVRDEGRGGVGRRGGSREHRDPLIRNPERVRSALPPAGRHAAHGRAGTPTSMRAQGIASRSDGTTPTDRRVPGPRCRAMSPPLFTYACATPGRAASTVTASSATAPATAAIGVTNRPVQARTAATMRRAMVPAGIARCGDSGLRRRGSSPARSPSQSGNTSDQRPVCVLDRVSGAAGAHDQVDRTVLQEEPVPGQPRCRCAVREPGSAQADRRRCPAAAAGRELHRRGVSGYVVRHRIRGVTHDSNAAGGSLLHGVGLERADLHRHRQRAIPSRRGGYSSPVDTRFRGDDGRHAGPPSGATPACAGTAALRPAPLPPARERSPLRLRSMRT